MRIRHRLPNLVAVDFYRRGDLLACAAHIGAIRAACETGAVHRYRGRYLMTAILFLFELPVFAALAVGAAVTGALAAAAGLARRLRPRRE